MSIRGNEVAGESCGFVSVVVAAIRAWRRRVIVVLALCALPAGAADIQGGFVVDLDIGPLLSRLTRGAVERYLTRNDCNIATVGYRFMGEPGQTFIYAGESFEIENDGSTELIATRRDGRRYEPVDQYGFADRELAMPKVRVKR